MRKLAQLIGKAASALVGLGLMAACSSTPVKPFTQEQYERALSRGTERFQAGDLRLARSHFLQAVQAAEMEDAGTRRAQALLSVGAVSTLLEDDTQAQAAYRAGLEEALRNHDRRSAVLARLGLAHLALRQGQAEAALKAYEEMLAPAYALDVGEQTLAQNGRALALAANQQLPQAIALLRKLEDGMRATPSDMLAVTLSNTASLLLKSQQTETALRYAQEALALDRATHHPPAIAAGLMRLAEIYASQAQWMAAHDAADRAEKIFRYTGQQAALARLQTQRQRWPQ